MKYAVIIFSLLLSIGSYAAPDLDQPVSLAIKNFSGAEFLIEISKQANIKFVFDSKIKFHQKVSLFVKDESLKEILDGFAKIQNVVWIAQDDETIKITGK